MAPSAAAEQRQTPTPPDSLRRLLPFVLPYWRAESITVLLQLVGTGLSLTVPLMIRRIIDTALPEQDLRLLLGLVAAMLVLHVVSSALVLASDALFTRTGEAITRDLRSRLYERLLQQSVGYFQSGRTGQIMARLLGDVEAMRALTSDAVLVLFTNLFSFTLTLGFMLVLNLPLTLVGLLSVILLTLVFHVTGRRLRAAARRSRQCHGDVSEHIHESIAGACEIKAFHCQPTMATRFRQVLDRSFRSAVRVGVGSAQARVLTGLVMAIGPLLVYAVGGTSVIKGQLSLGTLVAFVAYLERLSAPLGGLSYLGIRIQTARAAMGRVFAFLDQEPAVAGLRSGLRMASPKGELRIEQVSFTYPSAAAPVIEGLTLRVQPGERVAIVGPSGAGKSTIASLVCRFVDPQAGAVRLDGKDLRALRTADLRRAVGIVPQETFLFHTSVRENLLLARPDATPEQIEQALWQAGASELVAALPKGIETIVGERGARLSGGQRQRLAIARALLQDPAIIVFDEATSSLDPETEQRVMAAMKQLMRDRTTLIIAHRLSSILAADRIVVIDNGRLVEQGPYHQLITHQGTFERLYRKDPDAPAVSVAPP